MKIETKTIEKQVYVARDGKEFDSEDSCSEYEAFLDRESIYEAAKAYMDVKEMSYDKKDTPGFIPLGLFVKEGGNIGDVKRRISKASSSGRKDYQFFRLENKKDAEMLAEIMSHDGARSEPVEILRKSGKMKFPCVARYAYDYQWGREIGTFEKEMELVKKYCKLHGYDIKLIKRD